MHIRERIIGMVSTAFARRHVNRGVNLQPLPTLAINPDQIKLVPEVQPIEFPIAIIVCRQHLKNSAEPCTFRVVGQIGELGDKDYPLARNKDHPEAGKTLAALVEHHTDMEIRGGILGHRNYHVYRYRDPNKEGSELNSLDNLVRAGNIIMSSSGGTFIPVGKI